MSDEETPVRRWLDHHGMSVEDLARRCDVSLGTMGLIARGKRRPTDELKVRIWHRTHAYEKEKGGKRPVGIHPAAWFGDFDEPTPTTKRRKGTAPPVKKRAR